MKLKQKRVGGWHGRPAHYRLEDTVVVEAKVGDLVCFNIHAPHASVQNTMDASRAMVRLGYVPDEVRA